MSVKHGHVRALCAYSNDMREGGIPVNSLLVRLLLLWRTDDGPTATEYAVLLALISVAVIGALSAFGVHMDNLYAILDGTLSVF